MKPESPLATAAIITAVVAVYLTAGTYAIAWLAGVTP
jgi:hypothetical protein